MKHFLSADKQKALISTLTKLGMKLETATKFAELEDNMFDVDISLAAHVGCTSYFREQMKQGIDGAIEKTEQGLACILAIRREAEERGLGENDFPIALMEVKNDLARNGITSIQ